VVAWEAISWYYAGPIITLHGRTTASDYMNILGNRVHPVFQILFPNNDANVRSWFEEHEDALQHLPWPAKSRGLNIIQPLWSG
jgi:hypothetical protein